MIHVCATCGSRNDHSIEAGVVHADIQYTAALCFNCGEVYIMESGPLGVIYREPTISELAEINEQYGPVLRTMRDFRAVNPRHSSG